MQNPKSKFQPYPRGGRRTRLFGVRPYKAQAESTQLRKPLLHFKFLSWEVAIHRI